MKEFKPRFSTRFSITEHIEAAESISEQDQLLFLQFVNKYRVGMEIGFYQKTVLKAVADGSAFRLYFAEWHLKKGGEVWTQQILVFLDRYRMQWRCYRADKWESPVILNDIFGVL